MKNRRSSRLKHPQLRPLTVAMLSLGTGMIAAAAHADSPAVVSTGAPVVVTATRIEQSSFDLPVSIDSVSKEQIQSQKIDANVSEILSRVPGTVVQNRETYSQEQQITIRGFGARSQFGVRGIKLLADGIPASTPDGQGGSGLFDLASARAIEVLRGPYSALYGNHSGGVVQIFTEDGPDRPTLTTNVTAGSYGTWKAGAKFGGQEGNLNYIGSLSRFETDGYREWSDARKDQFNAKLRYAPDAKSAWTVVLNYLDQPDNLDPLGLTAAQVAQDRRQANPDALTYRTRRSLNNQQGGLVFESAITDADSLRAMAYVGTRSNEQFLAVPTSAQNNIRHSGGVSTFDRDFGGAGVRWTRTAGSATFTTGADYERAKDDRKGYRNDPNNVLGSQGALKRDEENTVWQGGAYVQAEWQPTSDWSASAGLRYTKVSFDSNDHFICTTTQVTEPGTTAGRCSGAPAAITATNFNPDDSGSKTFFAWTPVAGLVYHLTPAANLYVSAGRSFEAPTFIELAYRPDGSSGLNFDLQPSKSNHIEVGAKTFLGNDTRLNLALFQIYTDNEIVTYSNTGGRTTFQNGGKTERRGVELALDSRLGAGFTGYLAATYLEAEFKEDYRTCVPVLPATTCAAPNATVSAGNRIPGIPNYQVYGEVTWRYAPLGFSTGFEGRWSGKVLANDVNTVSTDSYFVANLRAGFEQTIGPWRLSEFVRVDNLFDEKYIGSVYVNDVNGRFFAPAPEQNYLAGVSANYRF